MQFYGVLCLLLNTWRKSRSRKMDGLLQISNDREGGGVLKKHKKLRNKPTIIWGHPLQVLSLHAILWGAPSVAK